MRSITVHLLPELFEESDLAGAVAVVIDTLRATTTVVHALAAGAREVRLCLEVDEARALAATLPAADCVLGGERQGVRIEGFDLGNSPTEYTPSTVGGKTVVFTTTNGTKAARRCRYAQRTLLAALVNRQAVAEAVADESNIHIVCAGTRGEITGEDTLTAGAIIDAIQQADSQPAQLNAEGLLALSSWRGACESPTLVEPLRHTLGGHNLIAEGFESDIVTAAALDQFDLVSELDTATWTARMAVQTVAAASPSPRGRGG